MMIVIRIMRIITIIIVIMIITLIMIMIRFCWARLTRHFATGQKCDVEWLRPRHDAVCIYIYIYIYYCI